jgi:hypothetical protein
MAGYNPIVDTDNEEAETMLDVMGAKVDLEFTVTEAAQLKKSYENIYLTYQLGFIGADLVKADTSGVTNRP